MEALVDERERGATRALGAAGKNEMLRLLETPVADLETGAPPDAEAGRPASPG
jgi:hypothetical protein